MNAPIFPERHSQWGLQAAAWRSLAILLATAALGTVSAHAQDATWVGASNEWTDPVNWTGGAVPSGTATFTDTGSTAVANALGDAQIGTILFTAAPNAQAYTFSIENTFIINGTGIVNNSTNTQTFNVSSGNNLIFNGGSSASGGTGAVQITNNAGGSIFFQNTSTAGTATITNNNIIQFFDTSTAGSSHITNQTGASLSFFNSASAGSATITSTVGSGATITFSNTSTAATSTIHVIDSTLNFNDTSTAGSATIDMPNGMHTGTINFNNGATAGSSNITVVGSLGIGGSLNFLGASTAGSATITNNPGIGGGGSTFFGTLGGTDTSNAGTAHITNNGSGSTSFFAQTTALNATITNNSGGSTNFQDQSTAGSATIVNNSGGATQFGVPVVGTDTATAGSANITNHAGGTTEFTAATTAGNATITNDAGGFLQFGDSGAGSSTATAGSAIITNNGTTSFNALTTAGSSVITTGSGGNVFFFDSSTGGNARFITNAGGTFDMSGLTAANMTAGSIEGAGSYVLGSKRLTVGGNDLSTTVSGVISGIGGSLTKTGTGTLTLTNTETYTGATIIFGGTLVVNGSIFASSGTNVNAGGTLAGTGTVGNVILAGAGATLAPGPLNGIGTLTAAHVGFSSNSIYMIQVNSTSASRVNASSANLSNATVNVNYLSTTLQSQYTILNASGGVTGTFNPNVVSNNANITSTLTYDANNVFLNTKLNFVTPNGALTINQQNVANALTDFFNRTGSIPMAFAALSPAGLTIASGELGTGMIQSSIKASDQFINLLLDPTIAGRAGGFSAQSVTPTGYADEEPLAYAARRSGSATDAFAMATKAPPLAPLHRWSVWAAGYGGSETVGGNAVVGSQDLSARVWGVAAGADYKVSPDTLFGFALGGGGTNYSLANAMGSGRTDMFNAGVYGRQNIGAAYLSAAFAYGWHDVTTNRTVPLAGIDMLQARFQAETFSGRFEGGYRFAMPFMGITPYAAAQVISVNLPNYSEVSQTGGLFALNYASQTVTDTRSELGLRGDKSFAMPDGVLTLRGRAAWAHDYDPNRAVTAIFQALPGASFVVNGARPDADSALVSASAERKWLNGFSIAGTFEGEFSGNVASYAGKGVVKYSW
jgi:uncharacterized protein with beta-barrel porin domain